MGGSRSTKTPGRMNRPFDLAEIARHEKWGDYTEARTTKDETAQKGDKDMAESLSSWYCDMGKVVIQSKHQQAEAWQKSSKQLVQDLADYHGMEAKEVVRRVTFYQQKHPEQAHHIYRWLCGNGYWRVVEDCSQDQARQLQCLLESADGRNSLVTVSGQRRGQEDSGANQGEAEAPALISAHPATRTMTRSSIGSADAGKQVDWLTSTAASLSRAHQHSAEYDSMLKSIGLATGAASITPRQEVHQPSNVMPQPKKDEYASGKSRGCRSSWLSLDIIFCLMILVCGLACSIAIIALLPKYPTHSSATAQVQYVQPVLTPYFGVSAVWIQSAAESQCSYWQPWAEFSSPSMCEAVATDVAAVDLADATAVPPQPAILIASETAQEDAETHGVERVAENAFAQHQADQYEATAVAAGSDSFTSADKDAVTPAVVSIEEEPSVAVEKATEVALCSLAAALHGSTGQTTAVAAADREATENQVPFSQFHQIDKAVEASATAELVVTAAAAVAVEVEVAEVDTADMHPSAAVAFESHSSTEPGLSVPATPTELHAVLAATAAALPAAAAVAGAHATPNTVADAAELHILSAATTATLPAAVAVAGVDAALVSVVTVDTPVATDGVSADAESDSMVADRAAVSLPLQDASTADVEATRSDFDTQSAEDRPAQQSSLTALVTSDEGSPPTEAAGGVQFILASEDVSAFHDSCPGMDVSSEANVPCITEQHIMTAAAFTHMPRSLCDTQSIRHAGNCITAEAVGKGIARAYSLTVAGDVFSPMVLLGTPELTLPGDAAETAATSLATLEYIYAEDQQAVAAVLAFSFPCFTPIKAEDKHGSNIVPACTIAGCAVYAMLQRARMSCGLTPFTAGHGKPLDGLLGSRQSQALGRHSCIGVVLGASGDSFASTTLALVFRQQDPTIAQGYPATEECGGYDAACLVSMTDDSEADLDADLMSSNVLLALQGMMRAASRCGYLPARICTSGLVTAEFGYIAQSCMVLDGSCPAPQPIRLPVNGLVAADSIQPPEWFSAQMVWSSVSILSSRTGLTRLPMWQLSTHASAEPPRPPNYTPGVPLLEQLAKAAAAQMQRELQDSLASCKSASTALVPMPASAITADPGSASQAKAESSMQALRQAVADMRAENGAQSVKDAGLLPKAALRHMVAGTSLTGRLAKMTAAQMQLAREDSMASSTAMSTALVAVVSTTSVAISAYTADDSIQAHMPHAVAYAAAAVHAAPVAEVEPPGSDLPLHGILPRTSLTAQLALKKAAQLQDALEADVRSQDAPSTALVAVRVSFGNRAVYCAHVEDGPSGAGSLQSLQAGENLAAQAPLASSGVSNGVSRGVSRTGLVPAVNVWQRIDMVAAGQTDNTVGQEDTTVGQEDTTAGGSLHALKAAVADMKKLHAISAGEVDSASMHRHVDVKGIVSISEQADVSTVLARVEEEILQLRRRLNVLEELLVSTRLTAERDLQH